MTTVLDRFLKQLEARGLSVGRGEGDTLVLRGPAAEKTPKVLAACKEFKPLLLEHFRAAPDVPGEPRPDAVATDPGPPPPDAEPEPP